MAGGEGGGGLHKSVTSLQRPVERALLTCSMRRSWNCMIENATASFLPPSGYHEMLDTVRLTGSGSLKTCESSRERARQPARRPNRGASTRGPPSRRRPSLRNRQGCQLQSCRPRNAARKAARNASHREALPPQVTAHMRRCTRDTGENAPGRPPPVHIARHPRRLPASPPRQGCTCTCTCTCTYRERLC